ncbi:hypothetical protein BGX34_005843 [Mortierella sp. NVP85]|nr:hypothetical protein BGX34_005843 [Mortierella sp. NVP85]
MTVNTNEQLVQAFRRQSTDEIVNIPAATDTKSGECFVLWSDIQGKIKNAESIRNGESLVPFMENDKSSKQTTSLRIAHHPGVVLEVVEGTGSPFDTPITTTGLITDTLSEQAPKDCDKDLGIESTTSTSTGNVTVLFGADSNHFNDMPEEAQSSLRAFIQLYNSYVGPNMETQTVNIKESMALHLGRLQNEMDKNKELQEQISKMQLHIQQLDQAKEEPRNGQTVADEKNGNTIESQQQGPDGLDNVQQRLQTLLAKTYRFYEDPIPRLFIVLRETTEPCDKPLSSSQFRLYFLCECGKHTMPKGCKTPHEIHLAKHEGYDLDKPREFFQKYGPYLLAMMYMIKHGAAAAGVIVPPLPNFKVADPTDDSKHLEYIRENIGPLVDDTINYLNEASRNAEASAEPTTDHSKFNKLEALEDADLRQLVSYLKIKGERRVLGNMYRIVTLEGNVKWVCFDHYRANNQETVIQQLRDTVNANNGKYEEEIGKIQIQISSNFLAKQFYAALTKTCGVQELEITMEWDAAMDELRGLSKAVIKANIVRLVVDGSHLKGSAVDVFNRHRRFEPLIEIPSKSRVQSFYLKGFDDFFSRINNPSLASAPRLRMFSMDWNVPCKDKALKSFDSFLGHCPSLAILEFNYQKQHPMTGTVGDILGKLRKLELLKIHRGNFLFTARVSGGKIQNMAMTIRRLRNLGMDDLKFIQQGHLTQLAIEYTPRDVDDDQLVEILRHNPRLNHLRLGCQEARCLAITNLIISTRRTLLQGGGEPCELQTFELMEEGLPPFDEKGVFDDKTRIFIRISFSKGTFDFDMRTWIRLQNRMPVAKQDAVCSFVREYGWSIVQLRAPWTLSDCFVAMLDDDLSWKGSQLEKVAVSPFRLSDSGLNHLENIIHRSQEFGLLLNNLDQGSHIEKAQFLLRRFGKMLSGISMAGNSLEQWLPQIAISFPTRKCFPNLNSFAIGHSNRIDFPSECLPWVLTMISAPSQEAEPLPTGPSSRNVDKKKRHPPKSVSGSTGSNPLPRNIVSIELVRLSFTSDEWKKVIESIDFSTLQGLSFLGSNLAEDQIRLLSDRISANETDALPIRTLNIRNTDAVNCVDPSDLEAMLSAIEKKAPSMKVMK